MAETEGDRIALRTVWVGLDESPVYAADQFISQFHQDLFTLSIGKVSPPPLLGDPEERMAQARALDYVAIRPIARIALTRGRLEELIDVLQRNLQHFDEANRESA